ncbi:MAG: hypothetical protein LQ351_004943 [Letrouitia transgressa]|nr:MAG: hypothetical protein LQ351_004943 [Letrouitia transgressa]
MPLIVTEDTENIKAVMSTQFSEFEKGEVFHKIWDCVLGTSIFSSDGEEWHAHKAQLRPFVSKIRPTDAAVLNRCMNNLLRHLSNEGQPCDMYDLIDRYVLDVVSEIFLGESADSLLSDKQPFRDNMEVLVRWNTAKTVLGPLGALVPDFPVRKSLKAINAYMDTYVQRTLSLSEEELKAKPDKCRTLADSLAVQRATPKDPVAIALSWAMFELSKAPHVVKKLRQEIQEKVGFSKPPELLQLKEMHYLRNVIRETLRMYHSLGFNSRTAKTDTTLPRGGGPTGQDPIGVLKGTQIILAVMSMQRRADIAGNDTLVFRPERYDEWTPGIWEQLPFNHGPRICLGRAFGNYHMEYTIVRIFQEFERIEIGPYPRPQQVKLELNTKPAWPVNCLFFKAAKESVDKDEPRL